MNAEMEKFKAMAMNARERAKRNYEAKKEDILQRRKEKYRASHPNPRPRGRPISSKPKEEEEAEVASP